MKTRIGFISNSSSSSYIIAITRDFVFSDEKIKELTEDLKIWNTDEDKEITEITVKETLLNTLNELCSGSGSFYEDEYPELAYEIIDMFRPEILLDTLEGGPDGGGHIFNCCADGNKEKIKKML